jgi:hypothetical protein
MLALLLLLPFSLVAQDVARGEVRDLTTRQPMEGVTVRHPGSGKTTTTDSAGRFSIAARKNDLLVFTIITHYPDTMVLLRLNGIEVYMEAKANMLEVVKIKGAVMRAGEMVDRMDNGRAGVYQRNADGTFKGGVALRTGFLSKLSRKEKRIRSAAAARQAGEQISRIFQRWNIAKYVPLEGTELDDFISLYRPTVRQFTTGSFDLLQYLNNAYKDWKQLPPEKRKLPPLPGIAPGTLKP